MVEHFFETGIVPRSHSRTPPSRAHFACSLHSHAHALTLNKKSCEQNYFRFTVGNYGKSRLTASL